MWRQHTVHFVTVFSDDFRPDLHGIYRVVVEEQSMDRHTSWKRVGKWDHYDLREYGIYTNIRTVFGADSFYKVVGFPVSRSGQWSD